MHSYQTHMPTRLLFVPRSFHLHYVLFVYFTDLKSFLVTNSRRMKKRKIIYQTNKQTSGHLDLNLSSYVAIAILIIKQSQIEFSVFFLLVLLTSAVCIELSLYLTPDRTRGLGVKFYFLYWSLKKLNTIQKSLFSTLDTLNGCKYSEVFR